MKRLAWTVVVVASVVGFAAVARAQTAPATATFRFTAVDAITVDHSTLQVTGVLAGEASAVTREFHFSFSAYSTSHPYDQRQSCERLALLAMSKPGQYVFTVTVTSYKYDYPSCSVARATP